jgi:hypothetical protein
MRFLEYQGEKIPLKIGFYALKHFQNETGKSMLELDNLTMEDLESLFYHSYVNGCKAGAAEGWKVKFEREEAETILEDNVAEFLLLVPELTNDCFNKKKSTPEPVKAKKAAKK